MKAPAFNYAEYRALKVENAEFKKQLTDYFNKGRIRK